MGWRPCQLSHVGLTLHNTLSESGRQCSGGFVDVRDLHKTVQEGQPDRTEGETQRNHRDDDFVTLIIENAVGQCGGRNDKRELADLADGQSGDEAATPAIAGQERL